MFFQPTRIFSLWVFFFRFFLARTHTRARAVDVDGVYYIYSLFFSLFPRFRRNALFFGRNTHFFGRNAFFFGRNAFFFGRNKPVFFTSFCPKTALFYPVFFQCSEEKAITSERIRISSEEIPFSSEEIIITSEEMPING